MEPPVGSFVMDRHTFIRPEKAVKSMKDMPLWEKSEAYKELMTFILMMNEVVRGKSLSSEIQISDRIKRLTALLDRLFEIVKECPPINQPQRFGNKAFKNWYEILKSRSASLLKETLSSEVHLAIPEISVYFEESFGNSTRIDYGTGHEASFIMFLCCLNRIGYFDNADKTAIVCSVFYRYLQLVRTLQQTYKMEPAGSHGVWSLDDFQFVPFIWGSSQLLGHSIIEPHKFLDEEILAKYGKDFMFLSCIEYIKCVKTGPFAEHSNQLWGISAVPSWVKINQGLIKMYTKEVIGKFPVVQHMLFGSLLSVQPAASPFKSIF